MAELLKDISMLQTSVAGRLAELTEKRSELRTLLNKQALRVRDKNRTLCYQQGHKPGKLLARALRQ